MIWHNIVKFSVKHWRTAVIVTAMLIFSVATLTLELNTLVTGRTPDEINTIQRTNINVIDSSSPMNTPYYIAVKTVNIIASDPLTSARIVSIIVGLSALIAFYILLISMFDERLSVIGVMLMLSSSWFLGSVRNGTPLGLYILFPLIYLVVANNLDVILDKKRYIMLIAPLLALSLYTPMMIVILILSVIFYPKSIFKITAKIPLTWRIAIPSIVAIIISPLIFMLIKNPQNIADWIGLPDQWVAVNEIPRNIARVALAIFYRSQPDSALHLGRLPYLDLFSAFLFAMGVYALLNNYRQKFNHLVIVLSVVLASIVGLSYLFSQPIIILIPFVYLVITYGFMELYGQWLAVFPRNPFARSIGIGMLIIAITVIGIYHSNRYFLAWPSSKDTKAIYRELN